MSEIVAGEEPRTDVLLLEDAVCCINVAHILLAQPDVENLNLAEMFLAVSKIHG